MPFDPRSRHRPPRQGDRGPPVHARLLAREAGARLCGATPSGRTTTPRAQQRASGCRRASCSARTRNSRRCSLFTSRRCAPAGGERRKRRPRPPCTALYRSVDALYRVVAGGGSSTVRKRTWLISFRRRGQHFLLRSGLRPLRQRLEILRSSAPAAASHFRLPLDVGVLPSGARVEVAAEINGGAHGRADGRLGQQQLGAGPPPLLAAAQPDAAAPDARFPVSRGGGSGMSRSIGGCDVPGARARAEADTIADSDR